MRTSERENLLGRKFHGNEGGMEAEIMRKDNFKVLWGCKKAPTIDQLDAIDRCWPDNELVEKPLRYHSIRDMEDAARDVDIVLTTPQLGLVAQVATARSLGAEWTRKIVYPQAGDCRGGGFVHGFFVASDGAVIEASVIRYEDRVASVLRDVVRSASGYDFTSEK